MAGRTVVYPIAADSSDGTGAMPTAGAPGSQPYLRNDAHFLSRVGEYWARHNGEFQKGVTYAIEQLPRGYSGWHRSRCPEGKHIDRYVYGHPRGPFRSVNEFFPHLEHLQKWGGSVGCRCKLCSGKRPAGASGSDSMVGGGFGDHSSVFPAEQPTIPPDTLQSRPKVKPKNVRVQSPIQGRTKQVDADGIRDVYRVLLDETLKAGQEGTGFRLFRDSMSPDWRAGHEMLIGLFDEWMKMPQYMPRCGEVVLFTRSISPDEGIAWHIPSQSLKRVDRLSQTWLDRPVWEAGVITQLPTEPLTAEDLEHVADGKVQSTAYFGFRVEPLNMPGAETKLSSGQHKYVPLHAIRPFMCWTDCVGCSEEQWHPTLRHALTAASSFSLVGRYMFQGLWPSATLFSKGLYLGPELLMPGDAVRLTSAKPETRQDTVTDVMILSSIRLRFVNLDDANDDDYDDTRPYNTCLHVVGKLYSLDPRRSFGGIGQTPVKAGLHEFPNGLLGYGNWFHVNDPQNPKAKTELPFTRVIGKCLDYDALQAWFQTPDNMKSEVTFQAVNSDPPDPRPKRPSLAQGARAILAARAYSKEHDRRINRQASQSWFWADTRIEQLDLHEINGKFVGVRDEDRTRKQIQAWKQALKVLDGKRGGVEDYQAALKLRDDEKRRESGHVPATFGMMATAGQEDSATDAEACEGAEEMDVDQDVKPETEQDIFEDALEAQLGSLNDRDADEDAPEAQLVSLNDRDADEDALQAQLGSLNDRDADEDASEAQLRSLNHRENTDEEADIMILD